MMKEFKEFISRGNSLRMALGIIVGGACTAIVSSLVADIITPIIGMLMGGVDFSSLAVTVGSANLTYGNFIQAIINFLLVAWVLFMIVKAMNKMKRKEEEKPAEPEAPAEPPEDIVLLREIRDSLKK